MATSGQLGRDIAGSTSTVPVTTSDLSGVTALAAGQSHSLALHSAGTMFSWGANGNGQLGIGDTFLRRTPVQVKNPNDPTGFLIGIKSIGAGLAHSLASVVDPPLDPDTTSPEIALNGDNPLLLISGDAYTEPGATVTDNLDSGLSATIDATAIDKDVLGVYQVTYNATDNAGNQAVQVIRTVIVVDVTAPTLTVPPDIEVVGTTVDGEIVDFDVTAVDDINPNPLVSCQPGSGSLFDFVETPVNCDANDGMSTGGVAWWQAEQNADDSVDGHDGAWNGTDSFAGGVFGDAFDLTGSNHVEASSFSQVGPFTVEMWAKAADPNQIVFTGVFSSVTGSGTPGAFQIELDGSGNYRLDYKEGTPDKFLTIGPAATQFQHIAVTFDGATVQTYLDGQAGASASWSDPDAGRFNAAKFGINRDNSPTRRFQGQIDEVKIHNRALNSAEIVATAFSAGNEATGDFTVTVIDTPPEIALDGDNPLLPNLGEIYDEPGATVTDIEDTGLSAIIDSASIDENVLGIYSVTYDATDSGGNDAVQVIRTVMVVDNTAPTLTPPDIEVPGTSSDGALVGFAVTADDDANPNPLVSCQPGSGSLFDFGDTTVNCSATDGMSSGGVAWWQAEQDADDSVDGHDGTVVGVSFETGVFGQAFSFDGGAGSDVSIPHNDNLNLIQFTISAWIKTEAAFADWGPISVKEGDNRGDPWRTRNWWFGLCATGVSECNSGQLALFGSTNGAVWSLSGGPALNDGNFHHVAVTYDGAGSAQFYVDGAAVTPGVARGTAGAPDFNVQPAHIGRWRILAGGTSFVGLIDEVKIHNRVLNSDEIVATAFSAGNEGAGDFTVTVDVLQLTVDIKPSKLNLHGKGVVPVALRGDTGILSLVDPVTIRFGVTGTEVPPQHGGHLSASQLKLHFRYSDLGIETSVEGEAPEGGTGIPIDLILTGNLVGPSEGVLGAPFEGTGTVLLVRNYLPKLVEPIPAVAPGIEGLNPGQGPGNSGNPNANSGQGNGNNGNGIGNQGQGNNGDSDNQDEDEGDDDPPANGNNGGGNTNLHEDKSNAGGNSENNGGSNAGGNNEENGGSNAGGNGKDNGGGKGNGKGKNK